MSTRMHLRTAVSRAAAGALPLALTGLVLGGCRAADRVAVSSSGGGGPVSTGSSARGSTDPLADVEATVDAVDRDVDADAGAAGR